MERLKGLVQRVNLQQNEIDDLKVQASRFKGDAASFSLSYEAMKQRHDRIVAWAELNKPGILKLLKAVERQDREAKAGVKRPINVTVKQTRRQAPKIETNATITDEYIQT